MRRAMDLVRVFVLYVIKLMELLTECFQMHASAHFLEYSANVSFHVSGLASCFLR